MVGLSFLFPGLSSNITMQDRAVTDRAEGSIAQRGQVKNQTRGADGA